MKKKLLVELMTGLLVLGMAGSAVATPIQWQAAVGGNDHWYDIVSSINGIYFDDARLAAVAMEGYLATPNLAGEGDFIFNNLTAPTASGAGNLGYWLGAYSEGLADSYQWQWVTGGYVTTWGGPTYIDWSINGNFYDWSGPQGLIQFPNGWWTSGNMLQDLPMIYGVSGYVVEFENLATSVPEPATVLLFGIGIAGLTGTTLKRRNP